MEAQRHPHPHTADIWSHALSAEDGARDSLRTRVVITGIGVVAPSGSGGGRFWEVLVGGRSCVGGLDRFDVSDFPVRIAATVPDLGAGIIGENPLRRHLSRFSQLAVAATRQAAEDSGLPAERFASSSAGLVLGTAAGAIEVGEAQASRFERRGPRAVHPTFPAMLSPNSATAACADELGICGPIATISSDCPSGLDAVSLAYRQVQAGVVNVAIAGASEAPLTPMLFAGFARSGMLAGANGERPDEACRPFDRSRSGFVLGEGAAMLVLERADLALQRGAHIYGEIVGTGAGRDRPEQRGGTDPDGQGYLVASLQAMSEARVAASELGLVSAHALGMLATDRAEARALHALLGRHVASVPVTSIKGAVGHPLATAGVLQIVSAALSMERGLIPCTVNCRSLDAECRLDVVRDAARVAKPEAALVTSHGFGGNSTAVVLRALPDDLR